MGDCKLTREAYEQCIAENIAAIEQSNMALLEAEHTKRVLRDSVRCYYDSAMKDAIDERDESISRLVEENTKLLGENIDACLDRDRLTAKLFELRRFTEQERSYALSMKEASRGDTYQYWFWHGRLQTYNEIIAQLDAKHYSES